MAVEPLDFPLDKSSGNRLGIHPIPLVRRTVTAFIGRTERGPINEPIVLESFDQYRAAFGGHCSLSFVSHAVQHYFMHGGQIAIVVRVANRATRARIEVPADGQFLHLQARHPGAHEFLRVSVDYDRVQDSPERFNLVVQRLRGPGTSLIGDQEIYSGISMRHSDQRFVVDALQESKLVRLSGPLPGNRPNATLPSFTGQPIPYLPMTVPGTDGDELTDYDIIGSNREGTGIFALGQTGGADLLCIPAAPYADHGTTAFLAAERFCEKHRAILIWDPPASWTSAHSAAIGIRNAGYSSRNAMTYFPRIRPRGEYGRFPSGLPACGAVAGLLALRDSGGIWRAAEPSGGTLNGSLTPTMNLRPVDVALLKRFGINALAPAGGGSADLEGNATLDGANGLSRYWQRLDRRRLLFFILKSIEAATRWVTIQLESDAAPGQLDRQVRVFLAGLFEQGAFAGKAATQAFFVQASREPAETAIALRFGIALHNAGDFLMYDMLYRPSGTALRHIPSLEAEQLVL